MEPHEHPAFWAGPEGRVFADAVLHEHLVCDGITTTTTGGPADASITEWQQRGNKATASNPNPWKMQNDVYDRCGKLAGQLDSLGTVVSTDNGALYNHVYAKVYEARETITDCYDGVDGFDAGGDPRSPTTMEQFAIAYMPVLSKIANYPAGTTKLDEADALALKSATYVTRVPHALTLRPWQLRVLAAIFHNPSPSDVSPLFNPSVTQRQALVDVWQRRGLRAGVPEAYEQAVLNPPVQCKLDIRTKRHPLVLKPDNPNPEEGMGSRFAPDQLFPNGGWTEPVSATAGAQETFTMQQRWVVTGGGKFLEGKATTWDGLRAQVRTRLRQLLLLLGDQTSSAKNGAFYNIRLFADDEIEAILDALTPELLGWTRAASGEHQPVPDKAGSGSWWDSILRWAEGGWDGTSAQLIPGPLRQALAAVNGQPDPHATDAAAYEYGQPRVLQRAMEAARGLPPPAAAPPAAAAAAAPPAAAAAPPAAADPQAGFAYRLVVTPEEVWNAPRFSYADVPDKHKPDGAPSIFFASMRGYAWALSTVTDTSGLTAKQKTDYDYEHRYHRKIDGPGVMRYVVSTDAQWEAMRAYIRDGWKPPEVRRIAMASREGLKPNGSGQFPLAKPTAWRSQKTRLVASDAVYNTDLDAIGRKTLAHSPWEDAGLQFENDVYIGPLYGDGPVRSSNPTLKEGGNPLSMGKNARIVANMGRGSGMTGTHIWFHHHCSYSGEWYDDVPHGRGRFVHGLFLVAQGTALSPPFIWIGEWDHGERTDAEGWLGQYSFDGEATSAHLKNVAWARFDPTNPHGDPGALKGVTWKKGRWPQYGNFVEIVAPAAAPVVDYKTVLARSETLADNVLAQKDPKGVVSTGDGSTSSQRQPVSDALRKLVALPAKYQADAALVEALDKSDEVKGKTVLREVDSATLQEFQDFFATTDPRHLGQGADAENYAKHESGDPGSWNQPAGVEDLQSGKNVYGRLVPLKVFHIDYRHQFTAPAGASSASAADKVRMTDQYTHIRDTIIKSRKETKWTRKRIMPAQRRSEANPRGVSAVTADSSVVGKITENGTTSVIDKFFCDASKCASLADDAELEKAVTDVDKTLDDDSNVPSAERKYHKLSRPHVDWPSPAAHAAAQLDNATKVATCALKGSDARLAPEGRVNAHGTEVGLLTSEVKTRSGVLAEKQHLKNDLSKSSNGPLTRAANETLLLHGTSSTNAALVITGGFASRFAKQPYFGLGLYFAEEPAKCDQYGRLAYGSALTPSKSADLGMRELLDISDDSLKANPAALTSSMGNQDVFYMLVVRAALGTPAHVGHRTVKDHNRRGNFMSPEWDYYDRTDVQVSQLPEDLKKLATQKPSTDGGPATFEATPALLEGVWKHHWETKPDAEKYKHSERVDRVLEGLRQKRDFLKSGEHGKSYHLRSLSTLFVENKFFDTGRRRRYAEGNDANLIPRVGWHSSWGNTNFAFKAEDGFLNYNIDKQEQLHRSHHSLLANGYGSRTMLANGNHTTPDADGSKYGSLMKAREFVFFQQYEHKAMPLLPAYLVAYKRVKQPDSLATSKAQAMQPAVGSDQTNGYNDKSMVLRPIGFQTSSHWEMDDPYSPLGEHDRTRWRHTLRDYPTIYRFSPYLWGRKTRLDSYAPRALFNYWNDYYRAVQQPAATFTSTTGPLAGRHRATEGQAYYPDETGPYDANGDYSAAGSSQASGST